MFIGRKDRHSLTKKQILHERSELVGFLPEETTNAFRGG
jgi:hypothetical protein